MNISKSLMTSLAVVFMSFFAFGTAHAIQAPSIKSEPLVTKVHLYKGKYGHNHHKHVVKCVVWRKDYYGTRYCAKIKKSWVLIKKRHNTYKKKDNYRRGSY